MKKIIFIILLVLTFTNCEEVIDVDIPSEKPRLVIDAVMRVDTSQRVQILSVKVSVTDSFFGEVAVTGLKQITITNLGIPSTFANPSFQVLLEVTPGIYEKEVVTSFLTKGELVFQVEHEDQRYLARTQYVPAVPIDTLILGDGTLLIGDQIEVNVMFTDNSARNDFYLFDFGFDEFFTTEDEFYQGQQFEFSYLYDKILESGQEVDVSIIGVDRPFYNYMNLLIEQSERDLDLFDTPVATLRGNIINVTEIDNIDFFDNLDQTNNFALGYFAVVQSFTKTIIIE